MRLRMILFIFSCYAVVFAVTPPFMLNDEPDHFQYVYWLSRGVYPRMPLKSGVFAFDPQITRIYDVVETASNDNRIPDYGKIKQALEKNAPFLTGSRDIPLTYQVHHPPLYFILALLFFLPARLLGAGLIPSYYATRMVSFLFYMLSVLVAYRICRRFVKKDTTAQYLAAVFAINPVTLKMGIAVNPDIASLFMSLLILHLHLRLVSAPSIAPKTFLQNSLALAVSLLVKFQNTAFLGFSFFFFLLKGLWRNNVRTYLKAALMVPAALIPALPWILHSLRTYGSITPSYRAYTFFCTANLPAVPWYRIPLETVTEFRHAFFHFAGFWGWGEPYPFKLFFVPYALVFVILIILGLYRTAVSGERTWTTLALYAFFSVVFFVGVSFTYKINRYSCDIQGRYLLAALLPFVLFAFRGITHLAGRLKERTAFYLFLFAVWQFYFILMTVIIPRYHV